MDTLLWVSLSIGLLFWILPVGLLLYAILFKLGMESRIALRLGYTVGGILSWVWAVLIPWTPWSGTTIAPFTAWYAGAPWHYAVIAAAPGALWIIIAWLVKPS